MTLTWRKSSHSGGMSDEVCVELARFTSAVGVRDSKNPQVGNLTLTGREFAALIAKIKRL